MKKIIFLSLLFALPAQAKFMNLRYGLMTGPMIEFGFGNFGFGVNATSASMSGTDGGSNYTGKASMLGGRLSLYSSGMGIGSWYAAASAGTVKTTLDQNISGTDFNGENTSTYFGANVGYHWFWSHFNMHFGLGTFSLKVGDTQVKDSAGTVGNTIEGFNFTLPSIDFGIGVAF